MCRACLPKKRNTTAECASMCCDILKQNMQGKNYGKTILKPTWLVLNNILLFLSNYNTNEGCGNSHGHTFPGWS